MCVGCQSGPRPAAEFVQQASLLHAGGLQQAVVSEKDPVEYLGLVGKRIVSGAAAVNADFTKDPTLAGIQFHVVASPVVNVYGTGGGHIYLYNGLLQLCESEEDLAALLAVQFAHALDLDLQKSGMRPDLNGGGDPLALSRVVLLFMTAPISAEQKLAADRLGFLIYARAGWDPAKFSRIYDRLRTLGLDQPASAAAADGQSRPSLATRIATINDARQKLPTEVREWRAATIAEPDVFREMIKAPAQKASARLIQPADRTALYLAAFPNMILPADQPAQQQAQTQIRRELIPPAPPAPKIEAS